ncbi:hypothetical protein Tco_0575084 [Tanacetum coccineum]
MGDLMRSTGIQGIGTWIHKKIVDPFIDILTRGAEPKQLAFSAALGLTLGMFPIVGPEISEVILMIVFLRFGEFLTGGDHFPLTTDALKKVLTGKGSTEILLSIARAFSTTVVSPRRDDAPSYTEVMLKDVFSSDYPVSALVLNLTVQA